MGRSPFAGALCEGVEGRRLISLSYRGRNRLVEPYCHGFSPDGTEFLVAFQRSGESSSGQPTGWKGFVVAELADIEVLGIPFVIDRPDYRPGGRSKNIVKVHCCV